MKQYKYPGICKAHVQVIHWKKEKDILKSYFGALVIEKDEQEDIIEFNHSSWEMSLWSKWT